MPALSLAPESGPRRPRGRGVRTSLVVFVVAELLAGSVGLPALSKSAVAAAAAQSAASASDGDGGSAEKNANDDSVRNPDRADAICFSPARTGEFGEFIHEIRSPYQSAPTRVSVLLPHAHRKRVPPAASADSRSELPAVLYVLPVEAGDGLRWGNSVKEAAETKLADQFGVACVFPTFAQLPWYADHPTDPRLRQESHLLKAVIPAVEAHYQIGGSAARRYLIGFSKSGWGAFTLVLRHPDQFRRAAAWDSPFLMDRPGPYGSGPIFGTEANFARYHLTELVRMRADALRKSNRLVLSGYGNFRGHHTRLHALLNELRIPHTYIDGPQRKHHWNSGWLAPTVRELILSQLQPAPPLTAPDRSERP